MKKLTKPLKPSLLLASFTAFFLMAFQFNSSNPSGYEPIMMDRSDMEASVLLRDARSIEAPGKIWIYNDMILLIEQYKGIHIIDNSNPGSSKTVAFIQVDGCTDITMKGNVLYANNGVDMIGIKPNNDFSDFTVIARNRKMLPNISSPEPWNDWYYYNILPANTVIVRWIPISN